MAEARPQAHAAAIGGAELAIANGSLHSLRRTLEGAVRQELGRQGCQRVFGFTRADLRPIHAGSFEFLRPLVEAKGWFANTVEVLGRPLVDGVPLRKGNNW